MRTRDERLLEYFLDHEGQAISTFTLERIAGRRSWRTVVSLSRQLARQLRRDIVNEQSWRGKGRRRYCDSRYRLVKVPRKAA